LSVLSCLSAYLSVLSVTLVYSGQTVGWIKMKLGMMEVGIGPGHLVLDEDPAPVPKGARPLIFGPNLLMWPNAWMDPDTTW